MDPLKLLFAEIFIITGCIHFLHPGAFLKIMPSWLPWHRFWVYLSGFLEIVFGAILIMPQLSEIGAWGLIVVLLGVFPANIHMAINSKQYSAIPAWLLWLRLPLQFVLIGWAWLYV